MKLEYYIKQHIGSDRRYVKDKEKRMWLTKLTKKATITDSMAQALEGLGIELVEVSQNERNR